MVFKFKIHDVAPHDVVCHHDKYTRRIKGRKEVAGTFCGSPSTESDEVRRWVICRLVATDDFSVKGISGIPKCPECLREPSR